ncbi:septal ring lytic transglycosylase RlpA family protein [Pistricoccus aurantiacus]|uniref:Endolytic peptidoglycan transglycosylase RlpA n=1 Tax=Pistricoccus aurantiacus TaxID=1883414 RepID=A0A5B8STF1_9GAMM|nr:septal ring lytic transglycosylase RlpA family protein [Pistricoccus aurantiacus]QEA40309.1 septal ring lytic transglycosylase RlpA family protein [Pistricoccus aurantiacus]
MKAILILLGAATLLAGCSGGGGTRPDTADKPVDAGGRYAMQSDAYPELPPDVAKVPNAVPRVEPRAAGGNKPVYSVWGKTYRVLDDASGYSRQGTASWYGEKFQGYATASGDIYDMYEMTAAHKTLPLPTYARVTNLDNQRSVIVRINDRGPFHEDREIDLSYAAAAKLDILGRGTGRVQVDAIDPVAWQAARRQDAGPGVVAATPPPAETRPAQSASSTAGAPVYLQVAALGSMDSARSLKARLQNELSTPVRVESDERLHRVQVGPVNGPGELEPLRATLRQAGFPKTLVIDTAR